MTEKAQTTLRRALELICDGELVDCLARALCSTDGNDPEGLVSVDNGPFNRYWKLYTTKAEQELKDHGI